MMKILAFLLLAGAGAQPQPQAQPQAAPPSLNASTLEAAIQPRLPQPISAGVSLVAAAAQGDLLVLTIETSATQLAELTPAGVGLAVATGMCAAPGAREAMAGPLSLRVDARAPGGATVTGTVFETCTLPPAGRQPS